MIRIARYEDLDQIMDIVQETIEDLQNEGDYQWDETYPSKEIFEEDIKNSQLYIEEKNDEVAGFICINKHEDKAYTRLPWRRTDEALVIHRFAVKRIYQRQKIGSTLIEFTESFAKNKDIHYIKVDTNSTNSRMNALFKHLGFKFIGTINLRDVKEPFNCYDKILD